MKRKTFIQFLSEAPITDYKTFGDFSKNSSFRDKRDRFLITNPKTIEHVKKKFGNTDYNINTYFINSPKADKWTEVGDVKIDWVRRELGDEVADHIEPKLNDDAINIIFTNNKGGERVNMTAWMIAHRMMHSLARPAGNNRNQFEQYKHAGEHFISQLNNLLDCYSGGQQIDVPRGAFNGRPDKREHQLLLKNLGQQICTFKSAREGVIRDWFEVLNELGAQYVTTGKIKFNKAPKIIKSGRTQLRLNDEDSANEILSMLGRDMQYMIDDIFSSAVNHILVM